MNKLALLSLILIAAPALPAAADHPSGATRADLRQLQTEMELLDDALRQVPADHPQEREFRRREAELRDELVSMRTQVRQHQNERTAALGPSHADVEDLRRAAADLRGDVERALAISSRRAGGDVMLPDGTEISVRLDRGVSSRSARVEDRVEGEVAQSVVRDGVVAIPAGTRVLGTVRSVERAERPSRGGRLEIEFDTLLMDDGRRIDMQANLMSLEEEGLDKSKAGLGALIGGILGGVLEGGKGAVIGAILGGGGTIAASSGEDVELPAGTVLRLQLDRSLLVRR